MFEISPMSGVGEYKTRKGNQPGLFCFLGFLAPDTHSNKGWLFRRDMDMPTTLSPTTFHRHNRPLRTFLLESEVWFCALEMGRLMGWPLNGRTTRKLDADQRRMVTLVDHQGDQEEVLAVSESAVYVLLTHHYHGENRALRQWITHEVVPCLRDEQVPPAACHPCLSFLQWPGVSVSMLHWQSEPWIRLRDMPQVLAHVEGGSATGQASGKSWWQSARRMLGRV